MLDNDWLVTLERRANLGFVIFADKSFHFDTFQVFSLSSSAWYPTSTFCLLIFTFAMVFIVGASCFERAIKVAPFALKSFICRKSISLGGLSLNPNSRNHFKNLGFLLDKGSPKQKNDIVLWHDVINNTITSHKSNDNCPLALEELLKFLKKHCRRFSAIIYCRRLGTPNIFEELKTLNITIIDAKKRFLSKRKQKKVFYTSELLKIHPSPANELKFIRKLLSRENNLRSLVIQERSKTRRRKRSKSRKRVTVPLIDNTNVRSDF